MRSTVNMFYYYLFVIPGDLNVSSQDGEAEKETAAPGALEGWAN